MSGFVNQYPQYLTIPCGSDEKEYSPYSAGKQFPETQAFFNKGYFQPHSPVTPDFDETSTSPKLPKHKAELHFLAWVAYTQKEQKYCPLWNCGQGFDDHLAMLDHVCQCDHLLKGQYWCSSCKKPEKVKRFPCRKNQVPLSPVERFSSVAKKMMGKFLVHSKTYDSEPTANEEMLHRRCLVAAWLAGENQASYLDTLPTKRPGMEQNKYDKHFEIHGLSSEIKGTQSNETQDTSRLAELGAGPFSDMPQSSYFPVEKGLSDDRRTRALSRLPPLDTQSIYEFPSLPQEVGEASEWTGLCDVIISPLSPDEDIQETIISISSTVTSSSGYSISPDSGCTSNTRPSTWDNSPQESRVLGNVSKSNGTPSISHNALVVIPDSISDGDVSSSTESEKLAESSPNTAQESHWSKLSISPEKFALTLKPWTNKASLVESFFDALNQSLDHLKSILRQIPSKSPMIRDILSLAESNSVPLMGLDVLASILQGVHPTGILPVFAFIYVAYACAMVAFDSPSAFKTDSFLENSLFWIMEQGSNTKEIAKLWVEIWRSQNASSQYEALRDGSPSKHTLPETNLLVKSCEYFLDILENLDRKESLAWGFKPQDLTLIAEASHIMKELSQTYSREHFAILKTKIAKIQDMLHQGVVGDLRGLELELICIEEMHSEPAVTRMAFLNHIKRLFDDLYAVYTDGLLTNPRATHYIEDIGLLKNSISRSVFEVGRGSEEIGVCLQVSAEDEWEEDLQSGPTEISSTIEHLAKGITEPLNPNYNLITNFSFSLPPTSNHVSMAASYNSSYNEIEVIPSPILTPNSSSLPQPNSHHGRNWNDSINQSKVNDCSVNMASELDTGRDGDWYRGLDRPFRIKKALEEFEMSCRLINPRDKEIVALGGIRQSPVIGVNAPQFTHDTSPTSQTTKHVGLLLSSHPSPQSGSQSQRQILPQPQSEQEQHSADNIYRCECGAEFAGHTKYRASNIKRHRKWQHSDITYECNFPSCTSKFSRPDNLKSHQSKKHGHAGYLARSYDDFCGDGDEREEEVRSSKRPRTQECTDLVEVIDFDSNFF